jgi:hypothetical protein
MTGCLDSSEIDDILEPFCDAERHAAQQLYTAFAHVDQYVVASR